MYIYGIMSILPLPPPSLSEEQDLMAKRKWLEEEQEKVLSERKAINALEKVIL